MSSNILERIFAAALHSVGLVKVPIMDPWLDAQFVKAGARFGQEWTGYWKKQQQQQRKKKMAGD
eukprot:1302796-Alexandrium_andersonii.AAC.1